MGLLNKKTVDDINAKGKKVLVRCDFNVPLKDGVITDENRITAALPTIKKLIADGAQVILCSHLGKVKNGPNEKESLAPVAKRLAELLNQEVVFAADDTVVGENAKKAVAAMKDGDVVLLQNTRFRPEETKNGEEFSKELASLCDIYVNDAFGAAHRAHCSTVGVASFVEEAAVGYLMGKELQYLGNAVENPVRPFVTILGGAKVADKLNVIENKITDNILRTLKEGTIIVLVFDTDTRKTDILNYNITKLKAYKFISKVVTIPQVDNLEDELIRSCNIRKITEKFHAKNHAPK